MHYTSLSFSPLTSILCLYLYLHLFCFSLSLINFLPLFINLFTISISILLPPSLSLFVLLLCNAAFFSFPLYSLFSFSLFSLSLLIFPILSLSLQRYMLPNFHSVDTEECMLLDKCNKVLDLNLILKYLQLEGINSSQKSS